MEKTKTCSQCRSEKKITKFYTDRTLKDGTKSRRAECKECTKERADEWRKNNPKRRRKTALRYYHRLRLEVLLHYADGDTLACSCCGEDKIEFLTLDHINGNGAKHRRKVGKTKSVFQWIKRNDFPDGFQVLCMNCNFAKGTDGTCPHELECNNEYEPLDVNEFMKPKPRNTSRQRLITFNGKTQNLTQWAEETGIHRTTIALRIDRYDWSIEDALTKPSRLDRKKRQDELPEIESQDGRERLIEYNDKTQTIGEWAEETGIGRRTIQARLDRYNWTVEQALTTPVRGNKNAN